jgi:hypothetical protein
VKLDPQSGRLRCEVRVFGVEADRANLVGIDEPLRDLARALSSRRPRGAPALRGGPVRIDDHLSLPAVHSKRLRISAADVPIRAEVAEVKVFRGRLWVALSEQPEVQPESVPSAPLARP